MSEGGRARLVGFNHVAVEVGDLEEALRFYDRLFEVELRGRAPGMAFIDAGDQFIALSEGRTQPPDQHRHVGMVVDDREPIRRALSQEPSAEILPGPGLDFLDPWGTHWQVVEYADIQFTKVPGVLEGMGLGGVQGLEKSEKALSQLRDKGMS